MTITRIIVNCSNDTMGDNVTEADADGYRAWLADQLSVEFDGASVEVNDEQGLGGAAVDVDEDDEYYRAKDAVDQFIDRCWDRCGWEWVKPL